MCSILDTKNFIYDIQKKFIFEKIKCMTPNIIQVDRGKIDNEILELKSQIDKLTADLEAREILAKYLDSIAITDTPLKITSKPNLGVSDFILDFLKDGEKDTKEIINAYAVYTNLSYTKVSGNVSNALSRLKTVVKKINNREKTGGRKAGSAWFLI